MMELAFQPGLLPELPASSGLERKERKTGGLKGGTKGTVGGGSLGARMGERKENPIVRAMKAF